MVNSSKPVYYTPVIGWGVFVLVMSLLPSSELPNALIEMSDMIIHSCIYVVWTSLASWGVYKSVGQLSTKSSLYVWICAITFGLVVEFAQHFLTTYRHFEFSDILANTTGAVIGVLLSRFVLKKFS